MATALSLSACRAFPPLSRADRQADDVDLPVPYHFTVGALSGVTQGAVRREAASRES
jgi:hypothetical protein